MLTKHQHLLGYNTPRCPAALGHGGVRAVVPGEGVPRLSSSQSL